MTNLTFFRGLLAALRFLGVHYIDARQNDHHRRLTAALVVLPEGDQWPVLVPSPICGAYRELDTALLELQCGFLGEAAWAPYGVHLDISADRALEVLCAFGIEQGAVFLELAHHFISAGEVTESYGEAALASLRRC